MTPQADDDLRQLNRFSVEIAADPLAVQAAGGNVSVKSAAVMWITASGTWLADAEDRRIMVPVAFADYRETVLSNSDAAAADAGRFVVRGLHDSDLRPSVETAMHVGLPQKFVAHVHCVDTLAWAVQADPARHLARLLDGMNWCFIPYVTPGLPLARRIAGGCSKSTDVIVLGNHGLVVAAETLGALNDLLVNVLIGVEY